MKIHLILLISFFQYANAAGVAVLPALPAIGEVIGTIGKAIGIGGTVLGLAGDTKKQCPSCNPPVGKKYNIDYDPPGSHAHFPCSIDQGHWHYSVNNQNPKTCECYTKKHGFGGCGKPPADLYN